MTYWQLLIYQPDGVTLKATRGVTDAVKDLASLTGRPGSRSVGGDSDEANLNGIVDRLDLTARDVVLLQTSPDNATWTTIYRGVAVKPGAPGSNKASQIRLMGLRKRLEETITTLPVIPGGDVAAMARYALSSLTLPGGITYDAANAPDLGFSAGDRVPRLETLAETLDALAKLCPAFTVASGSTYTYDGVTYNAGDWVPPTTWGVDPSTGKAYFWRDTSAVLALTEGSNGVMAAWEELSAENVIDHPIVALATKPSPDPQSAKYWVAHTTSYAYEPEALAHDYQNPGTSYDAEALVVPDNVQDFLTATQWSDTGNGYGTNVMDGDPSTYETDPAGTTTYLGIYGAGAGGITVYGDPDVIALKLRYALDGNAAPHYLRMDRDYVDPTDLASGTLTFLRTDLLVWDIPTATNIEELLLLAPKDRRLGTPNRVNITIGTYGTGAGHFYLYELTPYNLDADALDRLAIASLQLPDSRAGNIIAYGQHLTAATQLQLTLAGGGTVTAKPGMYEYGISTERGIYTTIRLGQAYPADRQAERELLHARIDAASRDALRRIL